MHASVRACLLAASLSLASAATASSNGVHLPAAPQGPGGEDSIETSDGTRCRQSINSSGSYLDVGVSGSAASPLRNGGSLPGGFLLYSQDRDREALAYARVTIPLGKRPARLDCSRLYEIEIARLTRELELLKLAAD